MPAARCPVASQAISETSPSRWFWTPTSIAALELLADGGRRRSPASDRTGWCRTPAPCRCTRCRRRPRSSTPLDRCGDDLVDELLPRLVEPHDRPVVGESWPPGLRETLRPRRPRVGAANEVVDGVLLLRSVTSWLSPSACALIARREVVRSSAGRDRRSERSSGRLATLAGLSGCGRAARPHQLELLLHDPQLLGDEPLDMRR